MQQDILSSTMSTGVTAIDDLHYDFFRAMQRLADTADHEFATQYGEFVKHAERTFSTEEHWMEEIDCPLLRSHREQHARVLAGLHNVQRHVMDGDIALGREVAGTLLPQWFSIHASTMDVALGTALLITQASVAIPGDCEAAYVD